MSNNIKSVLEETRKFSPNADFIRNATVTPEKFKALNQKARDDFQGFWADLAREKLDWDQEFTQVLDESDKPFYRWFSDGKLNVSYNCVDRHLATKGDKTAIIFEDEAGNTSKLTYRQLHREICIFANALLRAGIKTGDRVIIYMPMNSQAVIAMQACARIGAIHSVVFGGFSPSSIHNRVCDAEATFVITADGAYRAGKIIPLKDAVDEALDLGGHKIEKVIVQKRLGNSVKMVENRDIYWDDFTAGVSDQHTPEAFDAEQILFLLYTSGSTAKPKGIVHTSAGYLLNAMVTSEWLFDLKDDDIYWCTADVGWITGHSYICYGPLASGKTVVIYEGGPSVPNMGRFWDIIDRHKVTVFYTAPTAIRAFIKAGDELVTSKDLSSLRLLGTVGEPINPEAWMWYHKLIGKEKCPIVDTWWQTETGAHMLAPIPAAVSTKPGSCTLPVPGIFAEVIDEEGNILEKGQGGTLVITKPWPSMLRGIWKDKQRYVDTYFPKSAYGYYLPGDSAHRDEDGYFWILGRIDDVLNVSGHRLGTAEIESALVAHPLVAESAVVGKKDDLTGEAVVAFVVMKGEVPEEGDSGALVKELSDWLRKEIGGLAKPKEIRFGPNLPKTRSGKIMRRLLRAIANEQEITQDTSTLEDPGILNYFLKVHR